MWNPNCIFTINLLLWEEIALYLTKEYDKPKLLYSRTESLTIWHFYICLYISYKYIYRNINVFHISFYTYTYIFIFLLWSICILGPPHTLGIVKANSIKTKKQIEQEHKTPLSSLRIHGPFIYIFFKPL